MTMEIWILEVKYGASGEWRLDNPIHLYKSQERAEAFMRERNAKAIHSEYRVARFERRA